MIAAGESEEEEEVGAVAGDLAGEVEYDQQRSATLRRYEYTMRFVMTAICTSERNKIQVDFCPKNPLNFSPNYCYIKKCLPDYIVISHDAL